MEIRNDEGALSALTAQTVKTASFQLNGCGLTSMTPPPPSLLTPH